MTDTIDAPDATWTVTSEERREFMRAYRRWWVRQPSIWVALCVAVGIVTAAAMVLDWHPVLAIVALLVSVVVLAWISVRQVRQVYPVGATFRSWAGATAYRLDGPGVGMEIRWDRIAGADVGPVAVHLRTRRPKQNLLMARQVLGEQTRARLDRGVDDGVSEPVAREDAPGERSVVIDRNLQIALCVATARRFGVAGWIVVVAAVLLVLLGVADADPWPALRTAGGLVLAMGAVAFATAVPTIGAYPIGSTISGSLGEYLVVRGPWGRTSIHRSKLKIVARTKHAIVFRSGAARVVVPRAILGEESVSPGVRDMRKSTHG
ncbi:hypothetical protein ACIRON_25050 [Nocardioides sp. NPDC101246]|uniref:hypothetical protein n=1 Tax=Nocardioides sp. NPDC101246 TaxID=3364336 RepID=UPI00380DE155